MRPLVPCPDSEPLGFRYVVAAWRFIFSPRLRTGLHFSTSFLPFLEKIFQKVCISTAIDGRTKESMKYEV
jgi:hypothetical protein